MDGVIYEEGVEMAAQVFQFYKTLYQEAFCGKFGV